MDPIMPKEGTLYSAKDWQAKLAGGAVRAFKSGFVPNPSTTRAELIAQECDFDGYAAAVVAAWLDPIESADGGHEITAPTVQFDGAAPGVATNIVGGFWIETPNVVGPPAVPETVVVMKKLNPEDEKLVGTLNTGIKFNPTFIVPSGLV